MAPIVAFIYAVGALAGQKLTVGVEALTVVCPAAGLGLALVMADRRAGLVGVFMGAAAVSWWREPSVLWTLLASAVATLQLAVAAWAMRRAIGYPPTLERGRTLVKLSTVILFVCLIAATISVPIQLLAGRVSPDAGWLTWLTVYAADAFGMMVFFPIGLALVGEPDGRLHTRARFGVPSLVAFGVFVCVFILVRRGGAEQRQELLEAQARLVVDRLEHATNVTEGQLQHMARALDPDDGTAHFSGLAQDVFRRNDAIVRLVWVADDCPGGCADQARSPTFETALPVELTPATEAGRLFGLDQVWVVVPARVGNLAARLKRGVHLNRALGEHSDNLAFINPDTAFGVGVGALVAPTALKANLFGQQTELLIRPTESFLHTHRDWESWFVLAGGMLFSGLLGYLMMLLHGSNEKLKAMVDDRTIRLSEVVRQDQLTQLLNRRSIEHELEMLLAGAEPFAVLFVDLDRFKRINDSLGHAAGDSLLIAVAGRLRASVRHDDLVGRLGGDEFVLALRGMRTREAAQIAAEKIVEAVRAPIEAYERTLRVSVSVGVSLWPHDAEDVAGLLRCADRAMYAVKGAGRDDFCLYTPALGGAPLDRLDLEQRLHTAVARDDSFVPYFQPQFDLRTGELVGAEALVRWYENDRVIPPGTFIDLAEELGLMVAIGQSCTEKACAAVARWDAQGLHLPRLAINVSAKQLAAPRVVDVLVETVTRFGLSPSRLTVELTEHIALDDPADMAARLADIRRLGCRISLDDFGTGYATLDMLQVLPLDELKIDRRFVADFEGNGGSITLASITLARALGLKTVAEGVEYPEQADVLVRVGCDEVQGYLYGRPMPADAFEEVLRKAAGGHDFRPPSSPGQITVSSSGIRAIRMSASAG